MKGTPWEPVPGKGESEFAVRVHLPVEAEEPKPVEPGEEAGNQEES